jgi:hypothetical protein
VVVLRNNISSRRSLVVRLDEPPPNRHGYGAMVEVEGPAGTQRRWIGGGSFQSVDAPEAYFGFGDLPAQTRVTVRVTLPGKPPREWRGVDLDQVFVAKSATAP